MPRIAASPATDSAGTLNLNGGVFATPRITISDQWIDNNLDGKIGVSATVNFNGGTLQTTADSGDFFNATAGGGGAVMTVNVLGGGTVINTLGLDNVPHTIRINVPLNHSGTGTDGGLFVTGGGAVTLNSACTYNGPTTVDASTTLTVTNSASLASPNVTVNGGGRLNLTAATNLGPLNSLSLASGSTVGATLGTGTLMNVTGAGAVSTAGVNYVVDASGTSLALGAYPVISQAAGNISGAVGTVTSTMRLYTTTAVVTPTAVTINVAASGNLAQSDSWDAVNTGGQVWDVGTSANWLSSDHLFYNLNSVTFDDAGLNGSMGGKNVFVPGTVHPAAITILSNSTDAPFVFQGAGAITGVGTTLTLSGPGGAVIDCLGGISTTGAVTISGGALELGRHAGSVNWAAPIVFDGGAIGVQGDGSDIYLSTTRYVASGVLTLSGQLSNTANGGFDKVDGGTVVIASASNPLTGVAKFEGGVTQVPVLANNGVTSSIGTASIQFAGGELYYTGPSITIDRSYQVVNSVSGGNSTFRIDHNVTLTAPVQSIGGQLWKTGYGMLTLNDPSGTDSAPDVLGSQFLVSEGPAQITAGVYSTSDWSDVGTRNGGAIASLTVSNGAHYNVATSLNIGNGDGDTQATLTVVGNGTQVNVGTWLQVSNGGSQMAVLDIGTAGGSDSPVVTNKDWLNVGMWNGNRGTVNIQGGTAANPATLLASTGTSGGPAGWGAFGVGNGYGVLNMSGYSHMEMQTDNYWAEMMGAVQWDGYDNTTSTAVVNLSGNASFVSPIGWLAGHIWDDTTGNNKYANCYITMTDNALLHIDFLSLGDAVNNTSYQFQRQNSDGSWTNYGPYNQQGQGTLVMSGNAILHVRVSGWAQGPCGQATGTMTGSAQFNADDWIALGNGTETTHNGQIYGGNATLSMSDNTRMTAANWVAVPNQSYDTGTLNMSGNAYVTAANWMAVPNASYATGILNMNGSAYVSTPDFQVGYGGKGTVTVGDGTGNAVLDCDSDRSGCRLRQQRHRGRAQPQRRRHRQNEPDPELELRRYGHFFDVEL